MAMKAAIRADWSYGEACRYDSGERYGAVKTVERCVAVAAGLQCYRHKKTPESLQLSGVFDFLANSLSADDAVSFPFADTFCETQDFVCPF